MITEAAKDAYMFIIQEQTANVKAPAMIEDIKNGLYAFT